MKARGRTSRPMRASAQMDDALQKLEELARRQQELAEQQRRGQQTPQQRWEQEMLRREAEQLQQQMQQLAQNAPLSRDGQQGQQGQQGQSGQAGAAGQAGSSGPAIAAGAQPARDRPGAGQMNQRLQNADAQQLRQTIDRLQQALQDMRQAASSQQAGTPQGEAGARRAADRLREAQQMFAGLRTAQSSSQVGDMARQAESLARRQQEFEGQMRRAFGPQGSGLDRSQAEQMAQQKEDEVGGPQAPGTANAKRHARLDGHPTPGRHQAAGCARRRAAAGTRARDGAQRGMDPPRNGRICAHVGVQHDAGFEQPARPAAHCRAGGGIRKRGPGPNRMARPPSKPSTRSSA